MFAEKVHGVVHLWYIYLCYDSLLKLPKCKQHPTRSASRGFLTHTVRKSREMTITFGWGEIFQRCLCVYIHPNWMVLITRRGLQYFLSSISDKGALEPGSWSAERQTQVYVMEGSWFVPISVLHIFLDNSVLMEILEVQVFIWLGLTIRLDESAWTRCSHTGRCTSHMELAFLKTSESG